VQSNPIAVSLSSEHGKRRLNDGLSDRLTIV
jgi:hypothetical protein